MDWLNANGLRAALYGLAALVALVAWWRERRGHRRPDWWPSFWLITALVLGAMAIGRLVNAETVLTALGRDEAVARGWYSDRHLAQVIVVGGLGVVWVLSVGLALWRVPERRRRYLPTAVIVLSLLCYAALRLVSLHEVDAVLHHRDVNDVRVGVIVELLGLAVAMFVTLELLARRFRPGVAR